MGIWCVWESSSAAGSRQAAACRCPWAHAASTSAEPGSNLPWGIREDDAQSAIDDGDALVNGATSQLTFLTGLESHIVQQCRFGECIFVDRVGVMNTHPPTKKVQQLVRITLQDIIRQAARGRVIQIL